ENFDELILTERRRNHALFNDPTVWPGHSEVVRNVLTIRQAEVHDRRILAAAPATTADLTKPQDLAVGIANHHGCADAITRCSVADVGADLAEVHQSSDHQVSLVCARVFPEFIVAVGVYKNVE